LKDKSNITRPPRRVNDRTTDSELDRPPDESHRHRIRRGRPKVTSTDTQIQGRHSASRGQEPPMTTSSDMAGKGKVKSQEKASGTNFLEISVPVRFEPHPVKLKVQPLVSSVQQELSRANSQTGKTTTQSSKNGSSAPFVTRAFGETSTLEPIPLRQRNTGANINSEQLESMVEKEKTVTEQPTSSSIGAKRLGMGPGGKAQEDQVQKPNAFVQELLRISPPFAGTNV